MDSDNESKYMTPQVTNVKQFLKIIQHCGRHHSIEKITKASVWKDYGY
jgi:hypothetical protein